MYVLISIIYLLSTPDYPFAINVEREFKTLAECDKYLKNLEVSLSKEDDKNQEGDKVTKIEWKATHHNKIMIVHGITLDKIKAKSYYSCSNYISGYNLEHP